MKYKLMNKTRQGIPLLLTNTNGKLQSWLLPARGTREIDGYEMSQAVTDLQVKGYIEVEEIHEAPVEVPVEG